VQKKVSSVRKITRYIAVYYFITRFVVDLYSEAVLQNNIEVYTVT